MNQYYLNVITSLQKGQIVKHRGKGNSMTPRIKSGQLQTLTPITDYSKLNVGDMVLCKVKGSVFTHLITAIREKNGVFQFQISNNHGYVNGWAPQQHVYGKVMQIED